MQSSSEEKAEVHPITAVEYAKIHAILQRIVGIRRAMVATASLGVAVSLFVFISAFVSGVARFLASPDIVFSQALAYAVGSFVPFIGVMGYLSTRVNKHIDRLSKGKYEPPILIE